MTKGSGLGELLSPARRRKAVAHVRERLGASERRACLLLAQGEHPRVVRERLGHSQISMTLDTPSHVVPSLQRDAAQQLGDLLTESG